MDNPALIPGPLSVHQLSELVEIEESGVLPLNASTKALAASLVVKATQGKLYGFTVTNTNAASQYVQVFDARSLPSNGAVPLFAKLLTASDATGFYYGSTGRAFEQGIVLCNSSTQGSLTIGSADCLFDAQYI